MKFRSFYFKLFLFMALSPAYLFAAPLAEVEVDAPFEPSSAIGLLLNGADTEQIQETALSRTASGRILVSFSTEGRKLGNDPMVSALVQGKDGELAYGHVRSLSARADLPSLKDIKVCSELPKNALDVQSNLSDLESLVHIRLQMRNNLQARLLLLLDENLNVEGNTGEKILSKIRKLESGFGLNYAKEFGADLPPLEFNDRLSRIIDVIKNFELTKKRRIAEEDAAVQDTPSPEAGSEPTNTPPAADSANVNQ